MKSRLFLTVLAGIGALGGCSSSNAPAGTDAGSDAPVATADGGDAGKPSSGNDASSTTDADPGNPPPPPPPPPPVGWRSVVGSGGFFGQTFDETTWLGRAVSDRPLFSVACWGNLRGWVSGGGGLVVHTENGGASWTAEDAHLGADLLAIRFGSPTLGVVAGAGGALAVTRNGGADWTVVPNASAATLRGAAVAGAVSVLLVVGDGGTVLRSADAGLTWAQLGISGAGDLRGVATDSGAHVVLAVDSLGAVWSSTDRGLTFAREAAAGAGLDGIAISDDGSRALAVGRAGAALTRDALGVWTRVVTGTTVDLHAALVTDAAARWYVAGESGTLLSSGDRGLRWTVTPLATRASLYGLEDL